MYRSLFNIITCPLRLMAVTLCLLCLTATEADATVTPLIERLGVKDGLSNNEVRCIFQDHNGFLWFGTYDGLNRYDGYTFKTFRNIPDDPNSLTHSYVNCITEDQSHNLWIGTRRGISVFNPVTGKFSPAYTTTGNSSHQINSYIKDLKSDPQGNVYAAVEDVGLILFEKGKLGGTVLPLHDSHPSTNHAITSISVGADQKLYFFVSGFGLCTLDSRHTVKLVTGEVKVANCIVTDRSGVWIGGGIGIFHYDLKKKVFDRRISLDSSHISSTRITALLQEPGQLWIATDGGGVNILNTAKGSVTYLSSGYNEHALSSNSVYCLYKDEQGRKWAGTLRGGINIIDEQKGGFQNILSEPPVRGGLLNNFVKSIDEDAKGNIWIGTDGGGLTIWDRKNGSFSNYIYNASQPGGISNNFITAITHDFKGRTWLATYGGGILRFDSETKAFKKYNPMRTDGKTICTNFWIIQEDQSHHLWAGGLQEGFFLYNPRSDKFELFDRNLKNVIALLQSRNGQLWAGTFEGLIKIDVQGRHHHFFSTKIPVRSLLEDSKGRFWLGTEGGLALFDRTSGRISRRYTTKDGLCNNNVLSMEEDSNCNLWLGTYSGLAKFEPALNRFTNFSQSDGILNKEFNFRASARLKDGEMAFGGINGLTLFKPSEIYAVKHSPNLVLDEIKVNNLPISLHPAYLTDVSNDQIRAITIPYDEAVLSFSYTAIEYSAQEKINYRYMLRGWDKQWNYPGHVRNAIYTHLSPGNYALKIECSNTEGQWVRSSVLLKITVLPPWYRTWWAYLTYTILVVSAVYWFIRYKFREHKLMYEVRLAKADAEKQRLIQEREKEINDRRIEFFTDISHEFRTPLSLIINPVKDLLSRSKDDDQHDLNIVFRNSRRLLSLVDQLLLFRKADAGVSQLKITALPIVQVCREVYLCFVQQAKASGITFEFEPVATDLVVYGDREKIEIVLFNLIGNAIKYTPKGGLVKIDFEESEDKVDIRITDTGHGIPKDIGEELFSKFYRSRKGDKYGRSGFGIGLYLAKQFAEDHSGSLTYTSEVNKGSIFLFSLKKGVEHFPHDVVTAAEAGASDLLTELLPEPEEQLPNRTGEPAVFKADNIFTDRRSVLVIDDDQEIRNYIKSILEARYIVYQAANGEEGVQTAQEKLPDLIICDVMMPGVNGIEVCSIIKSNPQLNYIPMILLTASASNENKLKGLESGADDYIQKPFEKDLLIARVANLIQIRNNLQNYFYNAITLRSDNIAVSEEYKLFLNRCIDIVEKHLLNPDFNIKVLADEIGMSHSNLYRKVKSLSGHTVNSFIRFIRLRKAAELLIQTEMNVNEVALETGFNNIKYFRTQFYKLFGQNPSEFARQKRPVFQKRFNVVD